MSFPDPLSSKFKPSNQNSMEYLPGENKRKLEEPVESKKKISIVKTGRAVLQVFSPKQEIPIGSPDSIRSSQSSPTGTPTIDDNNNNKIDSTALKIFDSDTICDIINVMNENARKEKDPEKKRLMFEVNYGKKTNSFPKAENHVHLEGFPVPKKIIEMAKKYDLFWDSKHKKFRRERYSRKHGYERMAAKDLPPELIDEIVKSMCVAEPRGNIPDINKVLLSIDFDNAFHVRGSVLDRIPLWEQLRMVMEDAEQNHVILRELMFGVYDIPVPKKFKDFVQKFHLKINEETVKKCNDELESKKLEDLLNPDELAKLKRKVLGRFGSDALDYYNKLIKLSYADAFCDYLNASLDAAEKTLAEKIQENKETILNPKIFEARSSITLKLLFEIMRHYSLGEFYAWLFCALKYVEKDNSRVTGINIDGPQKNENSIKNFDDQMKILKILRSIFKKAGKAIHTLEFLRSEMLKQSAEDELEKVLQAMGEGRLGHATKTAYTNNPTPNLIQMQEKAITVEISLTTAVITTGGDILEIPLKTFIESAIRVSLNTDDPGMVCNEGDENSFTNMYRELIKALTHFKLSHEDIKTMIRTAIDSSFLSGDNIYHISERDKKNLENIEVKKIHYELKKPFKDFDWEDPIKVRKIINQMALSDKEIKQCQLELSFRAHERDFFNNMKHYTKLSYIPENMVIFRI